MSGAASGDRTGLRVRMYRVGFGDCFLLSLPEEAGGQHVLVDCGVHPRGDAGTMEQVLEHIVETTGGQLALLVATHEHADHISGFGRFRERFSRLRIGELWMPWALDPEDPLANGLRLRRLALVKALTAHFRAEGAPAEVEGILQNLDLAANATAVDALRSGFDGAAGQVRYLRGGMSVASPAGLAALRIRVLGPPTDPDFLKRMEMPAAQSWKRLGAGGKVELANAIAPFAAKWTVEAAKARRLLGLRPAEERDLREGLLDSLSDLAFSLDSVVNNTSLVLLFTFKGRALLFPGDAQWGSWQSWLEEPGAADLLQQVSFLKVAHHGSHNATPKRALQGMTSDRLSAMVSTQSRPWTSIPQDLLMEALHEQTQGRVLRSDSVAAPGAPSGPPLRLPRGFRRGAFWLDYTAG